MDLITKLIMVTTIVLFSSCQGTQNIATFEQLQFVPGDGYEINVVKNSFTIEKLNDKFLYAYKTKGHKINLEYYFKSDTMTMKSELSSITFKLVDSLFVEYKQKEYQILKFKEANLSIDGGSILFLEKDHGVLLQMQNSWLFQKELIKTKSLPEAEILCRIIKANLLFYEGTETSKDIRPQIMPESINEFISE